MPKISENFQKVDDQGAKDKNFFKDNSKFLFLNEVGYWSY